MGEFYLDILAKFWGVYGLLCCCCLAVFIVLNCPVVVEKSWLKSGKNRIENRGNRMLKTQNFGSAGLNAAALL